MGNMLNKFKKFFIPTDRTPRSPFVTPQSLSFSPYVSSDLIKQLDDSEVLNFGIISKAIQIIASDIARVKFRHYKINNKNQKYEEQESEISYLLNDAPNNFITGYEFKKILIWNLFLYSKAYILIIADPKTQNIIQFVPLIPSSVQLVLNNENIPLNYNVTIPDNSEQFTFALEQIIEINYEIIQGFNDVKLTSLFKSTLSKWKANELNLINQMKHDVSYSTIVALDNYTDTQSRKDAENAIEAMIKNHQRQGIAAMVIDKRWQMQPGVNIGNSKIDTNLRNMTAIEICSIFGIPPQKLGIETSNKYNSFGELNKSYIDTSLAPLLNNIITKISNSILGHFRGSQKIKYSVKDLLSLDPKAIQEYAASAINNGWATPNEIREIAGYENREEGNDLLINSTLVQLKNQENRPQIPPNKNQSQKQPQQGENDG